VINRKEIALLVGTGNVMTVLKAKQCVSAAKRKGISYYSQRRENPWLLQSSLSKASLWKMLKKKNCLSRMKRVT
jgi:hypothetical protein